MKIRLLLVVTAAVSLLAGCAAMFSSFTTRTVDAGTCKMEAMDDRDNPDLYADFFYYWSGPCSDGYANGRGYQIQYIKTGVTAIHNVIARRGKATGTSLSFQNMTGDNWWQLHENFEDGINVSNVNGVEKKHIRRAQLPVGFQNALNEFARIHPDVLPVETVSTQQAMSAEAPAITASRQTGSNNQKSTANNDAGGNGFSNVLGMLGAAAKGAGMAGGKNAASYQAIGNALQTTDASAAGTDQAGALSGLTQVGALTQGDYVGVNLGKNVKFDQPVNQCVGLVNMPKQSTYDSPGPGLTNKCGFPIMVYWCADAIEAGGFANNMCAQHFNGKYSLEPGEKKKLEQIVRLKAFRAIACKKPFTSGGSQTIKWNGDDFRAPCINSSIYNWGD